MATYRITDPNTGKTIKVTGDSPPTEEELNQIFGSVSDSELGVSSDPKGADFFSTLLGKATGTSPEEGKRRIGLAGNMLGWKTDDYGNLTGVDREGVNNLGTGIGMGPALGAGVQTVKNAFPYLTKGGTARKAEEAAARATKAGVTDSWDDLVREITQEATERFGQGSDVKSAVKKWVAGETPAQLGSPKITPSELLKMRRQIQAKFGQSFFQKAIQGENIGTKVANTTRDVISKRLKDVAPDIKTADKVYSFYKKAGGDVPQLVRNGVIAYLGAKLLGGPISGMLNKATSSN